MKITIVTVTYGVTQSPPDYCNIKPSMSLSATLDEGDDALEVAAVLRGMVKGVIHAEVDDVLEAHDNEPRYSTEPRYRVIKTRSVMPFGDTCRFAVPCVAIVPDEAEIPRGYESVYVIARRGRYAYALRRATETSHDMQVALIDCADGDLSRLPALEESEGGRDDDLDI